MNIMKSMMKQKYVQMYMDMAKLVAKQSYCERKQVGCVIVTVDNVVLIGYNGTPSGFKNVCECEDGSKTLDHVLHAETNAISKAASSPASTKGGTLFCTASPCVDCAKAIIQANIETVYYNELYRDDSGILLLQEAGITVLMC